MLDQYTVSLKAASLGTGSGFPKERLVRGVNLLGRLESDYLIQCCFCCCFYLLFGGGIADLL